MLTKKISNKKNESFVAALTDILVRQGSLKTSEGAVIKQSFYDADASEFDAFLVDEELVSVAHMLRALEEYYKVASFDVVGYFFDHQLLCKFPKQVMLQYGFIPLEDDENTMVIITSDPSDTDLLVIIGNYVSYDVQFRVGLRHDILDAVKEFYDTSLTQDVEDDLYDVESGQKTNESDSETMEEQFFDEDDETIDFS